MTGGQAQLRHHLILPENLPQDHGALSKDVSETETAGGARNEQKARPSQSLGSLMASDLRSCCCLKRKTTGQS